MRGQPKFDMVDASVDGVSIFQADGHPTEEELGGPSATRAFLESQRPALNTSGFVPLDLRVIVAPDPVQDRIGSILLTDAEVERKKWAQTKGTLIAIGENAFKDWGEARRPQAGDRIVFAQYAGRTHKGADGKDYTVANDEDILAILED